MPDELKTSTIDQRITTAYTSFTSKAEAYPDMVTKWNGGSPEGMSCEQRAAYWKYMVLTKQLTDAAIKDALLTEMGVLKEFWGRFTYENDTLRYIG